jgi:hypothetical protein
MGSYHLSTQMQDYLPKSRPGRRTERMVTGDEGERFVENNLACQSCDSKEFLNLNDTKKNMPGVDIQCRRCGEYGQVKTFQEQPNGTTPIKQMRGGEENWDDVRIPSNSNTLKETLQKYHKNIRYYCIIYKNTLHGKEVQYIAITERLSLKNMYRGEQSIRAKNTKWICRI